MKEHNAILIATLIIIAVIAVVLASRKDLCEVRFRSDHAEIAVFMAYEPIQ